MSFKRRCLYTLVIVAVWLTIAEVNAQENFTAPSDIPTMIINRHNQELGAFSLLNFRYADYVSSNAEFEKTVKNLIRSEVLFYLMKDKNVTPSILFNEYDLFPTYRILVDSSPSKMWRDNTYQSTHPLFINEQIKLAYHFYQNELLNLSKQLISDTLPPYEEESPIDVAVDMPITNY